MGKLTVLSSTYFNVERVFFVRQITLQKNCFGHLMIYELLVDILSNHSEKMSS
jgi:hypothetical protein